MKRIIVSLICFLTAFPVYSAIVAIVAVPTGWKLENYVGNVVAAWYTGSPCNGNLSFSSNATIDDMNRFWSVIMTAQTTGAFVFVRYDNSTAPTSCVIVSFGMCPSGGVGC
jgi:hypothetical protein